jgi:hypothetical protein
MYNLGSYPGIVPAAVYVWNGRVYPEDKIEFNSQPWNDKILSGGAIINEL